MRRFLGISTGVLVVAIVATVSLAVVVPGARASQASTNIPVQKGPSVRHSDKNDVSPALRTIAGKPSPAGTVKRADDFAPLAGVHHGAPNNLQSPVQTSVGSLNTPTPSNNFEGVGSGFSGPNGTFTVNSAPPDTNGAVGLHDYVQIVNSDFAIFNKDTSRGAVGTVRYGPVAINTLWSGFGGLCQTDNDGDPVAAYDTAADRWVISQFAVTGANGTTTPFLQCIAVSTTGDPTGTWNRYSFSFSNFPDYPKMAVWPDAYYETYNLFNAAGTTFLGAEDCAMNRSQMQAGTAATQQCFTTSSSYGGLLASNLDGTTQPPAGSPNYVVALNTTTSLAFWKFHVDGRRPRTPPSPARRASPWRPTPRPAAAAPASRSRAPPSSLIRSPTA